MVMVATAYEAGPRVVKVLAPVNVMAVKAEAEPQTLPKILGLLAQFGIVPRMLSSQHIGNLLIIDLQFDVEESTRIHLLQAKMQEMICVERASLVQR